MKIYITYSKDRDLDNYINSVWRFKWNKHGRNNIKEQLLFGFPTKFKIELNATTTEVDARKVISKQLEKSIDVDKNASIVSQLKKRWKEKEHHVVKNLEDAYGEKFPFSELTIYLTSLKICPYSYAQRWIMVAIDKTADGQINTIVHELNHFMFYYYFPELRVKLGNQKYESLKEALTVLTNPNEQGYPAQQRIRDWLREQKGSVKEILTNSDGWMKLL